MRMFIVKGWQRIVATKAEFTSAQAVVKFCLVETKEILGIFWLTGCRRFIPFAVRLCSCNTTNGKHIAANYVHELS
jgi:hypothetical protein